MSHPSDNSPESDPPPADPLGVDRLDAQLRDVVVPPGLAARVKASLTPSNDEIDAWLVRVSVPSTLAARLREIPDDALLDEALADVATPFTLTGAIRLATPAQRLVRLGRAVYRLSLAAAWFMAVGLAFAGGGAAFLASVFPPPASDDDQFVMPYNGPLSIASDSRQPPDGALVRLAAGGVEQAVESVAGSEAARPAGLAIGSPDVANEPTEGAVYQWTSLVGAGLRPFDDAVLMRYGVLGSPQYADDRLPELEAPRMPRAAGIEPPRVRGYDRAFFLKHRTFPPISPAADAKLASLAVPLVTQSDVLSRLQRWLADNSLADDSLPPPSELRVEDFVAAMDYRLAAAPAGRVAIRTAGGPSPFAAAGTELLQVAVQAGGLASRPRLQTHLVLAIDLSQSMSRAGRLELLQQGVGRLLEQLGPHDLLSLVVFHEQVIHRVEHASRDHAPELRRLLADLSPRGGTNLADGLAQATSLAMVDALPAGSAKRLVLITDSQAHLSPTTLGQLDQLLTAARGVGVRLDVLDVSDRDEPDPVLADWARHLSGEAQSIAGSRQLYWSLVEALAGGSPVVASDAKLTLQFNPQAVAAYRLIGHEANALAAITPAAVQAELAAGESASALIELWFNPGEVDDVGFAELTWHDAAGQPQRVRQRLSRLQFAPTFGEAALSLQQAAIAAEVGQELRGSRTALRELGLKPATGRGLAGVIAVARETTWQLRQREDFQRLLEIAARLERMR